MLSFLFQVEREVESFNGLSHSLFKNDDHLPGMGLDLGGYTTSDVFKVRLINQISSTKITIGTTRIKST